MKFLVQYIKKIKYFENCGFTEEKELQEIAEIANYRHFHARDKLFDFGDQGDLFYIMLDGLVDLIIPDDKKEEEMHMQRQSTLFSRKETLTRMMKRAMWEKLEKANEER